MEIGKTPDIVTAALLEHNPRETVVMFTSAEAMERLGPVRSRFVLIAGLVFSNFGWIPGSQTIRQYHPRGPDKMEVWSYCLVDFPPLHPQQKGQSWLAGSAPGRWHTRA